MYLADLHIHSHFSRATSQTCDAPNLDLWARNKGLALIGTGDFTHPAWRQSLRDALVPAEDGLYVLRDDLRLPADACGAVEPARFVISGEISSIYKRNGKTRKVHNVILLPSLDAADALSRMLELIGNIHSDGRPILGLDSRDLLEITLEVCPEAIFIPAHIWTPHFSLFGAFSGFDTIEECFADLTGEIHALETGLSSDPPMNWRISALDRFTLVSNSDAHSPSKLGREANRIDAPLGYAPLKRAIETGEGFCGTLEFFPEEGKYHLDGHRSCGVRLDPEEAERLGGRCPVCGKRLTIGVQHRAWALSDRPEGYRPAGAKPFESLVPLAEVIAASAGVSAASKGVQQQYLRLLNELGPEFSILRELPAEDIERVAGPCVAEGIRRLRRGQVLRAGGFDGEYGTIELFTEAERAALIGQLALFGVGGKQRKQARTALPMRQREQDAPAPAAVQATPGINAAQQRAITAPEAAIQVIAGPGTGKTYTLVQRIQHLIQVCGVSPAAITAVTFTNQAASEMRERLSALLGPQTAAQLTIGTFHAICLTLLEPKPLLGEDETRALLGELVQDGNVRDVQRAISRVKCGASCEEAGVFPALVSAYQAALIKRNARDLDDLLLDALSVDAAFPHLLVDEFQDINAVQRRLVQKWSAAGLAGGGSLFVIGDADQSIYGFRGASARCFDELKQEIPELVTIPLEQNYRCTPEVLSAALGVINHNSGEARRLAPMRASGDPVRLVKTPDPQREGIWIAKEIARLTGGMDMLEAKNGERPMRPFSDIAVLCRTRKQLLRIEDCLRHDSIPCIVSGRDDALDDDAVRRAIRLFRSLLSDTPCPGALRADAELFRPLIAAEPPRLLLERYAALHGQSDALTRVMDMAVFHSSMADFLRMLTLGEEADLRRADGQTYASGAVRLMTLHGSKGLEFPVVFLAGLTEGQMPLTRAGRETDPEEERRLLFVGITRARDTLILTCGGRPSPFLSELPASVRAERACELPESRQLKLF